MPNKDLFSDRLLHWFDRHGRQHLPWQQNITAYRVWVSEIMLQQTQVRTVIAYFKRFMTRFPQVTDLAAASEDKVLHLWTGLGYYARARNLHKTAIIVTERYNAKFPMGLKELASLPGIGRTTAGAIAAIAYHQGATILDANVKRFLTRCFGIEGWPGQASTANILWRIAESLTPTHRVADYTQAMMDMGATLCTRTQPACHRCPFASDCVAYQTRRIGELPAKKPAAPRPVKTTLMLVIENIGGAVLLHKRPPGGLWGGLWSFPECHEDALDYMLHNYGIQPGTQRRLGSFRHTFTHFHLDITPIRVISYRQVPQISESDSQIWYNVKNPLEIGLTGPVTKLLSRWHNE